MRSKGVEEPSCLETAKALMESQVQAFNERRVDLINSLRDFKPPTSTKSAIYEWNSQMVVATEEIGKLEFLLTYLFAVFNLNFSFFKLHITLMISYKAI